MFKTIDIILILCFYRDNLFFTRKTYETHIHDCNSKLTFLFSHQSIYLIWWKLLASVARRKYAIIAFHTYVLRIRLMEPPHWWSLNGLTSSVKMVKILLRMTYNHILPLISSCNQTSCLKQANWAKFITSNIDLSILMCLWDVMIPKNSISRSSCNPIPRLPEDIKIYDHEMIEYDAKIGCLLICFCVRKWSKLVA